MKPAPRLSVAPSALQVRPVPLFAVTHVANALQLAQGRARAAQASADLREREKRERERALFHVRVRERQ